METAIEMTDIRWWPTKRFPIRSLSSDGRCLLWRAIAWFGSSLVRLIVLDFRENLFLCPATVEWFFSSLFILNRCYSHKITYSPISCRIFDAISSPNACTWMSRFQSPTNRNGIEQPNCTVEEPFFSYFHRNRYNRFQWFHHSEIENAGSISFSVRYSFDGSHRQLNDVKSEGIADEGDGKTIIIVMSCVV